MSSDFGKWERPWPEPPSSFSPPLEEYNTNDPAVLKAIIAALREKLRESEARACIAECREQNAIRTAFENGGLK